MARIYAGQTAEHRSDTRRRQFVDAAIELIGTRGLANTTVRGICEQANLSTRFFYENFESLDALAIVAYDHCVQDAFTTIYTTTVASTGEPVDRSRASITAILDYIEAHPAHARLVFVESLGSAPLAPKRHDTMRLFASAIAALTHITYAVDDTDPQVQATATFVAGGVAELLMSWLDGGMTQPRDDLIDQCARMIVAAADAATS